MGSWINYSTNGCFELGHSAASGAGADVLNFTSFYSKLTSDKIRFYPAEHSFVISGTEEVTEYLKIPMHIALPKDMLEMENHHVFLSGFDMWARRKNDPDGPKVISDGSAHKIYKLQLEVEDIKLNKEKKEIEFNLVVALGASCNSPECNPLNNKFDYRFLTYFSIISGNKELEVNHDIISNEYEWLQRSGDDSTNYAREIYREDFRQSHTLEGSAANLFNIGFPLISGFDIDIQKGCCRLLTNAAEYQHLLSLSLAVHPKEYNSNSGILSYDSDLFFKAWTREMPLLSYGSGGSIHYKAKVSLIQIADPVGKIEHDVRSDIIIWSTNPLNQLSADNPKAVNSLGLCE